MNNKNIEGSPESKESMERLQSILIEALQRTFSVHNDLGKSGEETVEKNQFGDTALKADIECENAVINFLKETKLPIRIISEEHGTVDLSENPQYLGILDGLDGSSLYKKERGEGKYGTMFGIFNTADPRYEDYLVGGIMQHATGRLFIGIKGEGAFVIEGNTKTSIQTSGATKLDKGALIYIDEYFDINKKTFSEKLAGFNTKYLGASAAYYAGVAEGSADFALECTRKNNLEIAIAYGLEMEAGGAMVDLDGNSLADKKYLEFGQTEKLPVITAATKELAEQLIGYIKG